MRPNGAFQIQHGIEAAGVPSLKTQSPSTLRWRLRVEIRQTCRFETTFMLGTPFGLMDSRRYRRAYQTSLMLTRMGSCLGKLPVGVNLSDVAAGGAQAPPSSGGALHSAFSGLSDVGAERPFAGVAFNKMRSASAKPAARKAPRDSTHAQTLGLKMLLDHSTRPGSRSSPRVGAGLTTRPFLGPSTDPV
jgi:hypothetical protein